LRWEAWTAEEEDSRPLALVRILVATVLGADLLRSAWLGLVGELWVPYKYGGLSTFRAKQWDWLTDLDPRAGVTTWGVALAALFCAALGWATRPALVLALLSLAQLGHLYPPGDRAIDRLLRTVLLVLLFSGAHQRWSLSGARAPQIPAWPARLIRYILVLVYLGAGMAKLGSTLAWVRLSGDVPLYRLLTDPMAGWIDPALAEPWQPLLRVGGWATIALELSAPLLLTRHARWWAIPGALMHLGIALTMELGMFSWGMLALYPLLFWPWLQAPADRLEATLDRGAGPGARAD
jgi:Vitamin K-dependent gamma-carboxylase